MFAHILGRFHRSLTHPAQSADPGAGLAQRLARAPAHQTGRLVANEHLRGFLIAVMRHHEEGRIPAAEWAEVARFMVGRRDGLPPCVAHLAPQWPRVSETACVLRELLRAPALGAGGSSESLIAQCQALLGFLKKQAKGEPWLAHGVAVEFQAMGSDAAIGALARVEVADMVGLQLGPLDGRQLRDCVGRIARLLSLLPQDAYPCVRDALSRVANEARWQLDLFAMPEDPRSPVQRCGMSLAE
jgi:hypothetical protein